MLYEVLPIPTGGRPDIIKGWMVLIKSGKSPLQGWWAMPTLRDTEGFGDWDSMKFL